MNATTQLRRARHRAPRRGVVVSLFKGIAAVGAAVLIAAGAAGGTFAYLNATAQLAAATTVTAGTASFTVTTVSALAGTNLTPLSTSAAYGTYTLTNTGDVRLTATPTATASSANSTALANTRLELAVVSTSTACAAATYTWSQTGNSAATGNLATLSVRDRVGNTSSSSAMRLCARATLLTTAPTGAQGATVSWSIVLNGAQAW